MKKYLALFYLALLGLFWWLTPDQSGFGPGAVLTAILGSGGHPNPPGYQTIGILAEIWNLLPHENQFLHLNHLGAFIAVSFFIKVQIFSYYLLKRLRPWKHPENLYWLSLFPIVIFLLSVGFYRHFIFFERYLFAALIMVAGMTLVLLRERRPSKWLDFSLGITIGFAVLSHLFAGLTLLVFAAFMLNRQRALSPRHWLFLSLGGFVGFLPVSWSFFKGYGHSFFNWGKVQTWEQFWFHFSRTERGHLPFLRPLEKLLRQIDMFAASFEEQFGYLTLLMLATMILLILLSRRDKIYRALFVSSFFAGFLAFAGTNFSLGPPGSTIGRAVEWMYGNYFLFLSVLLVLNCSLVFIYWEPKEKIRGWLSIGVISLILFPFVFWKLNLPHTYPKVLNQEIQAVFPKDSVVLSKSDSFVFPYELNRMRSPQYSGPLFIHTNLLARGWYIESLANSNLLPEELRALYQRSIDLYKIAESEFEKSGVDQIAQVRQKILDETIAYYENRSGAFLVDFETIDPAPYHEYTRWVREPWGIGERLFELNSETKPIDWRGQIPNLVNPVCHPSQKFWCDEMALQFRIYLEKREKLIRAVFPNEAQEIKTALHP